MDPEQLQSNGSILKLIFAVQVYDQKKRGIVGGKKMEKQEFRLFPGGTGNLDHLAGDDVIGNNPRIGESLVDNG